MPQSGRPHLAGLEIHTERLLLRPWRQDDVPAIVAAMASGELHRYARNLPHPYTTADGHRFVGEFASAAAANHTGVESAVVERVTGTVVGAVALRFAQRSAPASIGYWLDPAQWGRGFATEAVRALAGWGLRHESVRRLELSCDVRNVASAKVAMRAGFVFEAVRRDGHAQFARLTDDPDRPIPPAFPPLPAAGLSDGLITLRVPDAGDLEEFAQQEHDPLTLATGFTGSAHPHSAMASVLARGALDWLVGRVAPFTILDANTSRFAGTMHLRPVGPPGVAGLGYVVHPAFRGRGYATHALRLVSRWAFEEAGLGRLELGTKRDNLASQHAALRAGFRFEGVLPGRLANPDGTFSDEFRYGLLSPDDRWSAVAAEVRTDPA